MFMETVMETKDMSYYTDRLETLTGKKRAYWAAFSIRALEKILRREVRKESLQRNRCGRGSLTAGKGELRWDT
ncbi:MAG: hypothetical protein COV74_00165 [Candidatus Omnitrophica bacterium CG11_big_fil_rev_8_21_14_0_20_45_26]|uniref:Uncharacterized protein n=1 Tax=Candidatus Abzuiibacterium crystallinum TaxID=1974748 RepID=A0A2H0LSW8_9BACT|nr:MAG: hypothetical protein COV74_00165 [Candidatus Omnitrophica bacterium CG11_big_fil_rev_8_21_14_0_20_45_26]PIW64793.1 MAG: hypothetical protein COW12_04640 [Candidatus Omnitrophica bacterium CG12_big_fil_rev_8_21_14_0_65_45_16]